MPVYSPYRETRRVVLTDAAQSIANATASDVTWGTEVTDPRGWTSGGSATLTCPTGDEGAYSVSFVGGWATNPTITNFVSVQINGAATYSASVNVNLNEVTCSFDRTFAAGDTLKFVVYQASGAAINLTSRLEMSWLGP